MYLAGTPFVHMHCVHIFDLEDTLLTKLQHGDHCRCKKAPTMPSMYPNDANAKKVRLQSFVVFPLTSLMSTGKNNARGPKNARRKPTPTQSFLAFPEAASATSISCVAAAAAAKAFFSLVSFDSDSGNTNAAKRKLSSEKNMATQKTEVTLSTGAATLALLNRLRIGLNGCLII